MVQEEKATIEAIRIISPRRFKEGGAPILEADRINHQKDIIGNMEISPFVISMLRVCVDS